MTPKIKKNIGEEFTLFPMLPEENKKIPQYSQAIQVNIHHFYIIKEIGDASEFLDMINTLKTAEEHDTVFISLNTPGGDLNTTVQIISAMKQCAGTVVTCLEGEVCSAGTLLFLSGDRYIINPHCTFMIHNYSHLLGGKGKEVASRVKYSEDYFHKLARSIYTGFLTEDEIQQVFDDRDFWMDSDEVIRRLGLDEEDTGDIVEEKLNELTNQIISDEQPEED